VDSKIVKLATLCFLALAMTMFTACDSRAAEKLDLHGTSWRVVAIGDSKIQADPAMTMRFAARESESGEPVVLTTGCRTMQLQVTWDSSSDQISFDLVSPLSFPCEPTLAQQDEALRAAIKGVAPSWSVEGSQAITIHGMVDVRLQKLPDDDSPWPSSSANVTLTAEPHAEASSIVVEGAADLLDGSIITVGAIGIPDVDLPTGPTFSGRLPDESAVVQGGRYRAVLPASEWRAGVVMVTASFGPSTPGQPAAVVERFGAKGERLQGMQVEESRDGQRVMRVSEILLHG
jgi:hypothetical protein